MSKWSKRGESTTGGAANLVFFAMAFIVLYVILLPQADRDYLFYGTNNTIGTINTNNNSVNNIIFSQDNIQLTPSLTDDEFNIDLPPFELYTTIENKEYLQINPLRITRSIIFNNQKTVTFDVDDFKDVKNMQLSFKIDKAVGKLRIKVNNYLIAELDSLEFESYKNLQNPIIINKNILSEKGNTITFESTSPGIYFWRVNEFSLTYVSLYQNIERYNQQAVLTFDLSKNELANIEDTFLIYSVIVTNPSNIELRLNNRLLFSGEPTVEGESKHKILSTDLKEHNTITFSSQKGSYNFFDISIEGTYKQDEDKKYYFTVNVKKIKYEITFDLIDNVNRKRFYFYINDKPYSVDTTNSKVTIDIADSVQTGRNAITFSPTGQVAIAKASIVES